MSEYNKNKPLRVFEAFSGYGSQAMALDEIKKKHPGFEYQVVGIAEIDKYALQAYGAVHGHCPNYGDISLIDWEQVPDFDFFSYSSPCFVSGTLVLTDKGYKKIEDISSEDSVLTHTNKFRRVVKPMANSYTGNLYRINAMAFDSLVCTPEHPFYVRKRYRKWNNPSRRWDRLFNAPEWVEAKDLTKNHYLGVAINQNESYPVWNGVEDNRWGHHRNSNTLTEKFKQLSFWYLMGRYVGDGWKKTSHSGNGIIICCGGRNEDMLVETLNACGFNFCKTEERTVRKYTICSNELYAFVERYGYYAHGKRIDAETMNLPRPLLGWFLQGYFDADGNVDKGYYKATSVSRELIYGIGQCVAKVYQVPYKIYHSARQGKAMIEGREINQRDTYQIVFKKEKAGQDKAFYEDGYIWFPIKSITTEYAECPVYNMEVEEDNSYTANGCIVHNCQDFSNAGLQKGGEEGSGTRSSLLWECRRAIETKRPKYLMLENVKALVSKKFLPLFHKWLQVLEELGYTNYYAVLNAKDFGVPQNRERIFCISIHGEHDIYHLPTPIPLELRLKDVLEEEVDDKYVLSETAIQGFLKHNENHKAKGTGFLWIPKDVDNVGGGKLLIASQRDSSSVERPITISENLGGGNQSLIASEQQAHSAQRTIQYESASVASCLRARASLNATDNTILEHKKRLIMLYEIWSEGFRVSGETEGKAFKLGEQKAESFEEACDLFVKHNPQYQSSYKKIDGIPYYWGCRWFDNEADARKSFG